MSRAAIVTSVSAGNADIATITLANKAEYCLRHGYSLIADNRPYAEAVAATKTICDYLDVFEIVWCLDADTIITDMRPRFERLSCLGPHMTACEEGIVHWNRVNCGSTIWKDTPESRRLLGEITEKEAEWRGLPCGWQTWVEGHASVTVAPLRAFNSCEWSHPAGAAGEAGSHWRPGDFVYHPNGVFPFSDRLDRLKKRLGDVQR